MGRPRGRRRDPRCLAAAGPNGSVWMWDVSNPKAARPALMSSIKAVGLQRYASAPEGGSSSVSTDALRRPALSKSRSSMSFAQGRL